MGRRSLRRSDLGFLLGERGRSSERRSLLFVGEQIFEAFYEPVDDESYDCENDCDADNQHDFRRKNKHSFFPFGFDVICSVSLRKEGADVHAIHQVAGTHQ
jgi:hypothetical protein